MVQSSRATEQYTTGDVLTRGTPISGSYEQCSGSDCWGGTSGGHIPSWNGQAARWGYGGGILEWSTAISSALEQAGFQVDGYHYKWYVKNGDANAPQNDGHDYMRVSVNIYDTNNNRVYYKQFNLDGTYDWRYFTGTEYFTDSLPAEDLNTITIRAEGDDNGFWAGHYGPEFDVAYGDVRLIYSPLPIDPCDSIPVTDPTCPNYEVPGASIEELIPNIEMSLGDMTGDVVTDPVAELTQPIQEVADDTVTEEPVGGLADNSTQSPQGTDQEKNSGGGLSDAQKNALSAAAAQASAAEQVASASSASSLLAAEEANNDAVSATLENSAAMSSAQNSMSSSNSSGGGGSSNQNSGQSDQSGQDLGFTTSLEVAGGSVGSEATSVTVIDSAMQTKLDSLIQDLLQQTFDRIQQETKESATAGIDQKPSDDPSQDLTLASMQNPNFTQFTQATIPDAAGYDDKGIYLDQRVVDNPAGRFFNGASDEIHRKMVRSQYDR